MKNRLIAVLATTGAALSFAATSQAATPRHCPNVYVLRLAINVYGVRASGPSCGVARQIVLAWHARQQRISKSNGRFAVAGHGSPRLALRHAPRLLIEQRRGYRDIALHARPSGVPVHVGDMSRRPNMAPE